MRGLFAYDGPFMRGVEHVLNFAWLNILLLAGCLPVFTAGASITAAYSVAGRLREDDVKLTRAYWRAFRANFGRATAIFAILAAPPVIFFLLIQSLPEKCGEAACLLALTALTLSLMTSSWAFPMQANYPDRVFRTVMNSFDLAIAYLPTTLLLLALKALPILLAVLFPGAILLLLPVSAALPVYWCRCICGRTLRKHAEGC